MSDPTSMQSSAGAPIDRRHRMLFEAMDDGFCILQMLFDAQGRPVDYRFLEANPAFEAHTGLRDAIGRTARELVPNLDDSWFELYGKVALTGERAQFENHAPAMDDRWFEVSAIRVGAPELRQVALIFKNISGRKRAEAELAEALRREREARTAVSAERERLHDLFMQTPVAICIFVGPEHRFEFANPAYRALVGGRDVVGKTLFEALPEIRGQGLDVLLDKVLTTGETLHLDETRYELDVGSEFFRFVLAPRRTPDGGIDGVVASVADVTESAKARRRIEALAEELRKSEAQLQLVTDALPVLVSFVDSAERYQYANKAYEDWFGFPREQLVGRTVLEVIGEKAYAVLSPFVKRGLAGERFTFEQRSVPYRHGGTRDVRVTFIPHRGDAGSVDGYVALLEDVTQQRRSEDAMRRQAEFEQQLIGIVSHDLKNPISAIMMSAGTLLRRSDLDERQRRPVGRILTAAERASRMIRELLDFTQARLGGGLPVNPAPMELHQLVRQLVDETQLAHPERTIEVAQSGDGGGSWDSDRIAQVVGNLLSNALNYSPPGSAVQVRTRGESDQVVFEVHNGGAPIPTDVLPRLFQPMQRGTIAPTDSSRSVGLGLYIVNQIVRSHGGEVNVRSTQEEGTTFTVTLPRVAKSPSP